ncbi:RNA polymerase sigma-70 factor (sigma-E family) [Micromonospora sp. Llam0]|uniref:SigE family RNA polymerase sigma factor n=1 Tax=Micromonospora sp. Llam0 TaxID=2485143 RepID=UPI000F4AD66D|nr:SigE family RNA polymerase sigma factor [Micromonospora sp. Llam0]ROO50758.1 RNA polymerase sigma-70 factor (sigma-E family) [Micromonospora sp. Llam0]
MTFEDYVAARGPALVRLARLLTGDRHRAEDLTQEVLGRAYVRWRSISRTDRPDIYIRRMLVNANTSWWRRRSSRETPATAELINTALDRSAVHRPGHDPGTAAAEHDAMWRLVSGLPERQRAVLVLRYYEDLDDASIAEILDCSAATVRTHAMRALAKLRTRHLVTH